MVLSLVEPDFGCIEFKVDTLAALQSIEYIDKMTNILISISSVIKQTDL